MKYAVQIENLEKSYGTVKVLKGISVSIAAGEVFALLGVNGAGKTTTLECMEGLKRYDRGQIRITGKCGVQLQSSSLPKNIKAWEAVRYFAEWQRCGTDQETLLRLGVTPFLNKQYSQLSTGQKRRLHLAIALLGDPDILVLDEPTAGLDVEGRVGIHGEIRRLKACGKTIILASHDMAEVEELCDRIAILKDGVIAFTGTPSKLTEHSRNNFVLKIRFSQNPSSAHGFSFPSGPDGQGYYSFETPDIAELLGRMLPALQGRDVTILDIKAEQAGIEQRFLEIVKEGRL